MSAISKQDLNALSVQRIDTSEQFAAKLSELIRVLQFSHDEVKRLVGAEVAAEKAYKLAHSKAVLAACTSKEYTNAEARKAWAEMQSLDAWEAWQIAKFRRENCRDYMDSIKKALVAIQSIGASLRTEMQMGGIEPQTGRKR